MILSTDALERAVRGRLGYDCEISRDYEGRSYGPSLAVRMKPVCFICRPGWVQLEPHTPCHWPPPEFEQMSIMPGLSRLFDYESIGPLSTVQTVTLRAQRHCMMMEIEMTTPATIRYSTSTKWKAHPPSKRKRMDSWRRAPDMVKLRYAPLAGLDRVPWWARHPDTWRVDPLGTVAVRQDTYVYSQPNAREELTGLLEEHSREWCAKMAQVARSA